MMGAKDVGAEAVEFALVVPLFVILVFGVVDFGYMINRDTMINNASREGAREGSLDLNLNNVKCRIRQSLSTIETPGGGADCLPGGSPKVTLSITCIKPDGVTACTGTFPTDAASGGTVVVTVNYQHSWITPVGATIRPGGIALTKTTKMRIE
jgi:TadE-like protein